MKFKSRRNRFEPNFRFLRFDGDPAAAGGGGSAGGTPAAAAGPAVTASTDGGMSASVKMGGDSTIAEGSKTTFEMKPQTEAADTSWTSKLSDEYKVNPTIKGLLDKDVNELAKMVVSGESELGRMRQEKGAAAPAPDAKPEDVEKYFQAKYAPKDVKDYKLDERPANLPEGVDFNPETAKEFGALAHKLGLHPYQAKALQGAVVEMATKAQGVQAAALTKLSEGYTAKWGAQADAKLDRAGKFLSSMVPPENLQQFSALPAEARQVLAVVMDGFIDKYVNADTIQSMTNTTPATGGGESEAELTQALHKIQSDPAYQNPHVDKAKHETLRAQASATSQKLAALRGR